MVALAAVLLCAGAAELFCRMILPPPGFEPRAPNYPRRLYEPHAVRGCSYAPNFEADIEATDFTYRVRTNSLGLRGPEILEKFDGATVLAVGDSLTAGWGLALEEAWPTLLGPMFDEILSLGAACEFERGGIRSASHSPAGCVRQFP